MKTHSKKAKLRRHILSGRPITKIQGLRLYGILDIGNRIGEFRKEEGIPIVTTMVKKGGERFAKYSLGGNAQ
jgi:hypothetical protein